MSGIIRIDMIKGVEEGSTSVSPKSPTGKSTASPGISKRNLMIIGYSIMVAKSVYNTAMQEIRAGGNEELATTMSNITTTVAIAAGAYYSGGLTLIPLAVSSGTQLFAREKNAQRQNRARTYEASMRGSRVSYMQDGGYE